MRAIPSFIALDVGDSRVGIAIATKIARLARPYTTLANNDELIPAIRQIVESEAVERIIVGLPRNLSGEDTDQTRSVRAFADQLESLGIPVTFQDEALTSRKAEKELQGRGKPYARGDIDALAAVYILDDYLRQEA